MFMWSGFVVSLVFGPKNLKIIRLYLKLFAGQDSKKGRASEQAKMS